MERRYLVATLALVATFAIFSQAFGSGRLTKLPRSRAEAQADVACVRRTVAERIVAELQPYIGTRLPEPEQMVAELNIPDMSGVEQRVDDVQRVAEKQVARQKCQAAMQAQKAAQQVYRMQVLTNDQAQQLNDLSVVRAEELGSRAQEWGALADSRRIEVSVRALEHAQHVSAQAMARAQRVIGRSQMKVAYPQSGMPIHINFVSPQSGRFTIDVPAAPEPPTPTIY
jgi:hypothetical protein